MTRADKFLEGFKLGSLGVGSKKEITVVADVEQQERQLRKEFQAKDAEFEAKQKELKIKNYQWFVDMLKKTRYKIPTDTVEALRTDPQFLFRHLPDDIYKLCYKIYAKHESGKADKFSDAYREKWIEFKERSDNTDWQFSHDVTPIIKEQMESRWQFDKALQDLKKAQK
jgi:hypothetical protein